MKIIKYYRLAIKDLFRLIVFATTVWGIYETFNSVRDFVNRPILRVGVLPTWALSQKLIPLDRIGRADPEKVFSFAENVFGVQIKNGKGDLFAQLSQHPDQVIQVGRSDQNSIVLPILLNNVGHDNLRDFEMTMAFPQEGEKRGKKVPGINVVDFSTESLDLKELFVRKKWFKGSGTYREKIPDENIYDIYSQLGVTANYISVRGVLEGNDFQVIYLKLFVPPGVNKFAVVFHADSQQAFFDDQIFGQLVKIINTGEKIS